MSFVLPAGTDPSPAKRDPVLLLLLFVGLALGAFVAFKPAPAPPPAPVIVPVPAPTPASPCGPNRCPYREDLYGGLHFEYGCPWCSMLVTVSTRPGDYRSFQPRCGNCGNRMSFHHVRDPNQGSLGTKAEGAAKAEPSKKAEPRK